MKTSIYTKTKGIKRFSAMLGLMVLISGALIACGDSSSSDSAVPAAIYTGAETPAIITTENVSPLIRETFQGLVPGATVAPLAADPENGDALKSTPMAVALKAAFVEALNPVVDSASEIQRSAALDIGDMMSDTIAGDCGGTATYDASYNPIGGLISGDLTFDGFCAGGVTVNGGATFDGRMDLESGFLDNVTVTYSHLTTTAEGQSKEATGSLEVDFQDNDIFITTDMLLEELSSGLVYWVNNYAVEVTNDNNQVDISGRFYDPVHGYVDFVTAEPLIISGSSPIPSAGLIVFTGEAGAGGQPTSAQLRVISEIKCQLIADFDGDGVLEYDSGEILWTNL